ncbi:catalase family peroxidase [Rhodoblastus sp.]|uniref:catalase family peroxidase n=1 Tax=Rhodoblastus sp. TaxID=1962975 RepID=UPI0035B04434
MSRFAVNLAVKLFLGVGCAAVVFGALPAQAADDPSPDQMVDAIQNITGLHKGLRRNHGKGFCGAGTFKGDPDAAALSVSPLFSGESLPVLFRFSIAGPNPSAGDAAPAPRGLALQVTLPDGGLQDLVMINAPFFPSATVKSFYDFQVASASDPATGKPDPEKLKAYIASNPAAKTFVDWLKANNPPDSYGDSRYYSIHAFKFVDAAKQGHWVKWRFEPRDGAKALTAEEMAAAPHDFLEQKLADRLQTGPVEWDMIVTIGEPGDPLDNPTLLWPTERREIKAGTLSLTEAGSASAGTCEDVMFDPNLLGPGIEASPDPILAYRSGAYAVSYGRRLQEKTP